MHELRLSVLPRAARSARPVCVRISVVTQIRHRVSMDMSFGLQLYCEVCEHTLDTAHVHESISDLLTNVIVLSTHELR